jgi:hypothetical protein
MRQHSTHEPAAPQDEVQYRETVGFPNYRVGTDGSVWGRCNTRGRPTASWHLLKPRLSGPAWSRYFAVALPGRVQRKVHRLVLEAFVGPCPPGMECRHLNGVRTDNRLVNLAWGTKQENAADVRRHGHFAFGSRHVNSKLVEQDIPEILRLLAAGESLQKVAARFGVCPSTVWLIARGRRWKHALDGLAGTDVEVTVRHDGTCTISRAGEGGRGGTG